MPSGVCILYPVHWLHPFTVDVLLILQLLKVTRVHILPSMNPDGATKAVYGQCQDGDGRTNAYGVDLNTQFTSEYHIDMIIIGMVCVKKKRSIRCCRGVPVTPEQLTSNEHYCIITTRNVFNRHVPMSHDNKCLAGGYTSDMTITGSAANCGAGFVWWLDRRTVMRKKWVRIPTRARKQGTLSHLLHLWTEMCMVVPPAETDFNSDFRC